MWTLRERRSDCSIPIQNQKKKIVVVNTSNALKQSSHSLLISRTNHISFHQKEGRTVAPQRCGAISSPFRTNPPTGAWRPGVPREPMQSHRLDPNGLRVRHRRLRFCSSPAAKAWLQRWASDPPAHPENMKIRLQRTATNAEHPRL